MSLYAFCLEKEKTMTKKEMLAWGVAGISCVCAIGSYICHKRTASLLKKTVSEVAGMTPVEIEKEVVDQVVQEALEMKVDSQVDDILEETKKEIKSKIGVTVTAAVTAEMGRCHEQAAEAYSERIANLSEEDVKKAVVERSSQLVEKKLDNKFDDILRQYQKRLDEINSMYTRVIAKAPSLNVNSSVNPGLHLQW